MELALSMVLTSARFSHFGDQWEPFCRKQT